MHREAPSSSSRNILWKNIKNVKILENAIILTKQNSSDSKNYENNKKELSHYHNARTHSRFVDKVMSFSQEKTKIDHKEFDKNKQPERFIADSRNKPQNILQLIKINVIREQKNESKINPLPKFSTDNFKPISAENQSYIMRRSLREAAKASAQESMTNTTDQHKKSQNQTPEKNKKDNMANKFSPYFEDINAEGCRLHSRSLAEIDWDFTFEGSNTSDEPKITKTALSEINKIKSIFQVSDSYERLKTIARPHDIPKDLDILMKSVKNFSLELTS
ncbi:hypothetical protein HZS_6568 [Henneguya salminicola]|nr:hypothetical protein HZS_6568 [Henneguya salminicola]